MRKLRLILGDQLNIYHSWFNEIDENVTYLIIESKSETDYTTHHIQKIVAFFLAMRQFGENLRSLGHKLIYFKFDDNQNKHNFTDNILNIISNSDNQFSNFEYQFLEYQLPDEYRLDVELKELSFKLNEIGIKSNFYDTEHFLTERNYLDIHFSKSKSYLMESFYRRIRKEYNILMISGQPIGGKWNFDSENRKKLPAKINIPKPFISKYNQTENIKSEIKNILANLADRKVKTIGNIDPENFIWATSREEAFEQFDYFLENQLENFGKYQDAMSNENWTLFHSRISFALNSKLISPLEIINKAVDFWEQNQDEISIAQIEGFVRQIIGWREFLRVIYWKFAPNYKENNFFENLSPLPQYYWSGNTKMNCMSKTINQSLDYAYAHHIQRLMITGNFALLNMTNPKEIEQWYLGIYIDALEWVEMPNTIGMSQFADGGILATKPYISSGNYINNMSNYCNNCFYDYKVRFGEKACPFNSLYWNFIDKNKDKLAKNQRMSIPLSSWAKMNPEDKNKILNQAQIYLENVDSL